MDKKFLEFWGNFLLGAAKGQDQVDDLQRLSREGLKIFENQWALFRKFYGLDNKLDASSSQEQIWAKATADFTQSYQKFIGLMGLVPREAYEALARENERLKKKSADLEVALRRRKKKTGGKDMEHAEVVKGFEALIKKQTDQFQALMASYGKLYENTILEGKSSQSSSPESAEEKR